MYVDNTSNESVETGSASSGASVFWFAAGGALIVLDQWLKHFFFSRNFSWSMQPWLQLVQFQNDKFAFSIPLRPAIIFSIYAVVLGILILYVHRNYKHFRTWDFFGWTLIFAGSVSNIAERIIFDYVRDYLSLYGGSVINAADIYIVVGLLILILAKPKK